MHKRYLWDKPDAHPWDYQEFRIKTVNDKEGRLDVPLLSLKWIMKPQRRLYKKSSYHIYINEGSFLLNDNDDKAYECTCPDFIYRRHSQGDICKHVSYIKGHLNEIKQMATAKGI
jgi:hypothetical protein